MEDIKRRSRKLHNRTNYFDPDTDKVSVEFVSPDSFSAKRSKIDGYLSRIYFEYKYCDEHDGQSFFYTLTYNDAHVPRYRDIVCFDYNDLTYLLNGGFKKKLERLYGTRMKYFVGAELGEGKGSRGIDNNPHYHVIFFLCPLKDSDVPYVKISPAEFRHLVKLYWQGFDEFTDGYRDYRTAKLGIAREGDNLGLITDFRACQYCSKYVTKDVSLVKYAKYLQRELALEFSDEFRKQPSLLEGFMYDVVFPKYNIPLNCTINFEGVQWMFDYKQLYLRICPEHSARLLRTMEFEQITPFLAAHGFIHELNLLDSFKEYVEGQLSLKIKDVINEFRNRYSNKCRISQGVGISALSSIETSSQSLKTKISQVIEDSQSRNKTVRDKVYDLPNDFIDSSISLRIPSTHGYRTVPICLYYYRKLFTDVVKDEEGKNIRVLNQLGINFKISQLPSRISKLSDKVYSYSKTLNEHSYVSMISSKLNISVSQPFSDFKNILHDESALKDACDVYSLFKLVYEDRFYELSEKRYPLSSGHPPIDVVSDFRRFLNPSYYQVDYSPCRLQYFIDSGHKGYLPYWSHPYFYPYLRCFSLFDLLLCYYSVQGDKVLEQSFEEEKRLKQFHGHGKLISYFNQFNSYGRSSKNCPSEAV